MKNILFVIYMAMFGTIICSCELDNYDAPNAKFYGQIVDSETNEPIPQDLIQGGVVEYVELGYDNPQIQNVIFKTDGSFRNNLMFSGKYVIQPVRGNVKSVPKDTVEISGDFEYIFKTKPYIKINDVNVVLSADKSKIIATFKLKTFVTDPVASIIMVADKNPSVGIGIRTQTTQVNINAAVDPNQTFTIEMPIGTLKKGNEYYFRVGALIKLPEAKNNWAQAVKISL